MSIFIALLIFSFNSNAKDSSQEEKEVQLTTDNLLSGSSVKSENSTTKLVTATLDGSRINFIAEEGKEVKRGELLVGYSLTTIQTRIKGAKAAVAATEANLTEGSGTSFGTPIIMIEKL